MADSRNTKGSNSTALSDEALSGIADAARTILSNIGEDPTRDGILDTPMRYAKAFSELTAGYRMDLNELINGALFDCEPSDMVIVRDIPFHSMCEHHMLPFYGTVDIAYVPRHKILGLSKFARVVKMFSQRLQVQERLGLEVAAALDSVLDSAAVGVVIKGSHMCMSMRGACCSGSETVTVATRGEFKLGGALRSEFLRAVKL